MQERRDDRSLGELFAELAKDTSTLVRQEVQLAKTEMSQKAANVGKAVGMLAVGGMVIYAGVLAILAAIIILLGGAIDNYWLSALIVGVVVAIIGYVLVQKGRTTLTNANLAPTETIATLKEDAQWTKEQTS